VHQAQSLGKVQGIVDRVIPAPEKAFWDMTGGEYIITY
jgi:hypothetical protein